MAPKLCNVVGKLTLRLVAAHQPGRHCWLRSPFGQAASSFTACERSVSQAEGRGSCAVPLMLVREQESVSRVRVRVLLRQARFRAWHQDMLRMLRQVDRRGHYSTGNGGPVKQVTTCAIGCPAPCPQPQPTPAPAQRTQAHQARLTPVGAQDALPELTAPCALPVSHLKRLQRIAPAKPAALASWSTAGPRADHPASW